MVYESQPFIVQAEEDVQLSPIEIKKQRIKQKEITRGILLKDGNPAGNYVLKVYKTAKKGAKTFIGFTFTDSFGQFIIPIPSNDIEYVIKVYALKEEKEGLELIVNP